MRDLLCDFVGDGCIVFVFSYLLVEVEQIAGYLLLLQEG